MDGFSTWPAAANLAASASIPRHLIVFLFGKKRTLLLFFLLYEPGAFSFNSITLPLSTQTLGRLAKTARHRVNGKVTLASGPRRRLGAADWNLDKAPPERGRQTGGEKKRAEGRWQVRKGGVRRVKHFPELRSQSLGPDELPINYKRQGKHPKNK